MNHRLKTNEEDFLPSLKGENIILSEEACGKTRNLGTVKIIGVFENEMRERFLKVQDIKTGEVFSLENIQRIDESSNGVVLETRRNIYRLFGANIIQKDNQSANGKFKIIEMSEKYLNENYLGFSDYMYDGFFDPGRDSKKLPNGVYTTEREIILLDIKKDIRLKKILVKAITELNPISDQKERIKRLAILVAEFFGGYNRSGKPRIDFVAESESFIENYTKSHGRKEIYIGNLPYGSCRHRSLLFKYLADRVCIKSRLVRGELNNGGHAWNIVRIDGSYYIVDIMNNPLNLIPEESFYADLYKRQSTDGKGSIGARSLID